MEKIFTFLKKNYLIATFMVAFIVLVIFMVVFWVGKKGTFSLDANNYINLVCPDGARASESVECSVYLTSNKTVLSVNANYDVTEGMQYSSFAADSNCSGNGCFTTLTENENGFVVINENGVSSPNELLIGSVTFTIPASAVLDADYTVGLNNIELCDNNYEMTELDNVSATINIIGDYLLFDESLNVDDTNNVIKRLPLGMTYGELKSKIETSGQLSITANNNAVADADVVRTNSVVTIELHDETVTYVLSVLGDITGNGQVLLNDVGMMYRYYKGKRDIGGWTDYSFMAADIVNDDDIKLNEVGILYRYYKKQRDSLEVGN